MVIYANNQKVCGKCKKTLPLDHFYKPHKYNHRMSWCKRCTIDNITKSRGGQPMDKSKSSSSFLGIHVAEQVAARLLEGVERLPNNNRGYDAIWQKDKTIDVKSACLRVREMGGPYWIFSIRRNKHDFPTQDSH